MLKRTQTFTLVFGLACLSGCVPYVHQQAIYVSPFNGNTGEYTTLPLRSDSIRSAFYLRGDYFAGSANDNNNDHLHGGKASAYWARHFGAFQCYSGLDLTMGVYNARAWDTGFNFSNRLIPPVNYKELDARGGRKFFGGTGFSAGINAVIPLGRGSEWRFLGVETSLYREFGVYHRFRTGLPDTLTTLDVRDRFYGTIGVSTEIIKKTRKGDWGFRMAGGSVLGSAYNYLNLYDSVSKRLLQYGYLNGSFHYTTGRFTGYLQMNGATRANTGHIGFVYRL